MSNYGGWRAVSRSLLVSKKWKRVSDEARVLWLAMLLASDSYGGLEADVSTILDECFPNVRGWTEQKVERALAELVDVRVPDDPDGLVIVYAADARHWLRIVDFEAHQINEFIKRRGKPSTPSPPEPWGNSEGTAGLAEPLQNSEQQGPAGVTSAPKAKAVSISSKQKHSVNTDVLIESVHAVFEHWRALEESIVGAAPDGSLLPGLRGPRLTEGRRKCIHTRLQNYSVGELCDAISGYLHDPWYLGANKNSTRYTDIKTIFKNDDRVEAGVAKLRQREVSKPKVQEVNRVRVAATAG